MTHSVRKTVMLVDDHPVFRDGLKTVVETHPDLRVVAEASNLPAALSLLQLTQPDMLITDLRLGQESGYDLIEAGRRINPELTIIVVSVNNRSEDVLRAIQGGASAYLTKGASREELLRAISEVLAGRSFLHPEIAHVLFDNARRPRLTEQSDVSAREQEILDLLCEGDAPKDIGEKLCLSLSTVKSHLRSLYRKFGVASRTQLVLKAIELRQGQRR